MPPAFTSKRTHTKLTQIRANWQPGDILTCYGYVFRLSLFPKIFGLILNGLILIFNIYTVPLSTKEVN